MFFLKKGKKVGNEKVNELICRITGKPQFYSYVNQLISEISAVQDSKRLVLELETKNALEALKTSLNAAKNTFDRATSAVHSLTGSGMSPLQYNQALYDFCQTSVNVIHQHQSTLMAAPGIWNKLKAYINNVLEEYIGLKDVLDVKESNIANSGEFKNRFNNVKSEGKYKMKEVEDNPFSHTI